MAEQATLPQVDEAMSEIGQVAQTVREQAPFPQTMPQPVDAAFVDILKDQEAVCMSAIDDLNKSINAMANRKDEYERCLNRVRKALEFEPPKTLEAS